MNKHIFAILMISCGCLFSLFGQDVKFEETDRFRLRAAQPADDKFYTYGYLTVPETWGNPNSRTLDIAVTVLKNTSGIENAKGLVFIQGGPGHSAIESAEVWMQHPAREKNDIILFDIRGTGLSLPRLCPELGRDLVKILAENQSQEEDEVEKTNAALACKQALISKGINTSAYNGHSISQDIHALKEHLRYDQWTVYGVSYGTYLAQVYTSKYPEDVAALILDSSIDNITDYYTQNTANYLSGLSRVFEHCKNDPDCNAQYPNLEKIYYETIADLHKNPLTVPVAKSVVETKEFTFNAEDFKVAIQQALYNRDFVEIIPITIYQFHQRNESALGNLVAAFASLLAMDYGLYYCVSCSEALPNNDFSDFENTAARFNGLMGGISFYRSDFKVCEKWNMGVPDSMLLQHDLSSLKDFSRPVLVLSGSFDPITPMTDAPKTARNFANSYVINAPLEGHASGFTTAGNQVVNDFLNNTGKEPSNKDFTDDASLAFVKDVALNSGVSSMGNSLKQFNIFFVAPLAIAFILMLTFLIVYVFNFIKKNYKTVPNRLVRFLSLLTSLAGIFVLSGFVKALLEVSEGNFYILAFGLPDAYSFLQSALIVFLVLFVITIVFFFSFIKKIEERSIVFSVIFSQLVLTSYFIYWGFF